LHALKTVSRGTEMAKGYLQAGAYYNEKNYSAAIPLLQKIYFQN